MKKLAQRFAGMGAQLERRLAKICAGSAQECVQRARALAPVDSGELRSGIGVREENGRGAAAISAAPHGAMVEFGTLRMAPRPYMLPAAQEVQNAYFEAARAAAKEVLK